MLLVTAITSHDQFHVCSPGQQDSMQAESCWFESLSQTLTAGNTRRHEYTARGAFMDPVLQLLLCE